MSKFINSLKKCIEIYETLEQQNPNLVYYKVIDKYLYEINSHVDCPTSFYGFAEPMIDLSYNHYLPQGWYINDETQEDEYHYEGRWERRKKLVDREGFLTLKSFEIEWCLPSKRIYLNGSTSLELLDNLFFTEGLILIHHNLFTQEYFTNSCIELFRKRIISNSNETYNRPMPKFKQIIAMIAENYEYLYNNGSELLNYNYTDKIPYTTKKLPNKLYREMTKEEFLTYIDLSKSRTENTEMFIEKTKMSASMFNNYMKKFDIKFEVRKPKKFNKNSNRLIQTVHHYDNNGSIWTQHEQFIFDFVCKNNNILGDDYIDHYDKDLDLYVLDNTKDGKDWKIVKSIRDNRTRAKYKVTTESKKQYKELLERMNTIVVEEPKEEIKPFDFKAFNDDFEAFCAKRKENNTKAEKTRHTAISQMSYDELFDWCDNHPSKAFRDDDMESHKVKVG